MNKLKGKQIKFNPIALLVALFAVVYAIRMYVVHPWYDELYTYYSFICRGPVYAGIHWPLPNNHIGYSVLSAFLNFTKSPTIALRGVSYLASCANIYLVYALSKKLLKAEDERVKTSYGLLASVLYATVNIVHTLAVQGRGYALSTTCFIVATMMVYDIANEEDNKLRWYIIYSIALALGIYLVPSSTFWVIPLCIIGGVYLLLAGKYKKLMCLIGFSAIAALIVLSLYGVIWLAIGSNLLSKTDGSGYFGIYQIDIIKMAPMLSLKTGIDYMMASPYIQSIPRQEVLSGLFNYLEALFTQFYPFMGIALIVFLSAVGIFSIVRFVMDRSRFLELFIGVQIIALPVLMIIQCKAPYLRVYTFFGVVTALAIVWLLSLIKTPKMVAYIFSVAMLMLLMTGSYNASLGEREDNILKTLKTFEAAGSSVNEIDDIFYLDDYQKYVIKFYYDLEPNEVTDISEAKYVMLPSDDMNGVWPFFYSENDGFREYVYENFKPITDEAEYVIYSR